MKISRRYPWALWTESICLSFTDSPVFPDLNNSTDWEIDIKFSYTDITDRMKDIFAILPDYIGFSACGGKVYLGITYLDRHDWIPTEHTIESEVTNSLVFKHSAKKYLKVLLNNKELFFTNLTNNSLKIDPKSCILLGTNTHTCEEEKDNEEIEIKDLRIFIKDKLVVHHDFSNIVYGKAVDLTGNYNFLYQLG